MQVSQIESQKQIKMYDITEPQKIHYAFEKLLYVPEEELKPHIIHELMIYLKMKLEDDLYPLKIFIAKEGRIISGIVVSQIDPEYRSYGRKCGTFGWLYATNFESCAALINACEEFMRAQNIRKLRGPINYPKLVGGLGFQIKGFSERMMSGVNFHRPNVRELHFLDRLGFERESKYSCVHVIKDKWEKGNIVDPSIKIRYKTLEEFKAMRKEIISLAKGSFHSILADAPGGKDRFDEMAHLFSLISQSHYKLSDNFDPREYTDVSEFLEAINFCDLENVITWMPMAFERNTGKLIGLIISLPNLFQIWRNESLTEANVDTVMISKDHTGKGIFSSLNNIGRIVTGINGISYAEGTSIWSNNDQAIKTIFPHSETIRTHIVLQKRIKN
ncbi:MAG: hypothetical protein ACQERB_10920 [Promethearchaeati archaeon]